MLGSVDEAPGAVNEVGVVMNQPLRPTRTHLTANRSNKNQRWSEEDDLKLTDLVGSGTDLDWTTIAAHFPHKTQQQVMERWTKVLDPNLTKGSWRREEDEIIVNYVREHGKKSWTKLAELLPGRIGKQCRERWMNLLDPDINHGPFTADEDKRIMELYSTYGSKWSKISSFMPNRTCNAIKNRWNSTLKKKSNQQITSLPEPQLAMTDISISSENPIMGGDKDMKVLLHSGESGLMTVTVMPVFTSIPLSVPPDQPNEQN